MPNGMVFQNYETEQLEDKTKFTQWGLSSNNRESVSTEIVLFLTFYSHESIPPFCVSR
jgi:hypothetical protein